jgi:hypothetical protein
LLESFRARGCRENQQGRKTRVSSVSKANWCYRLAWQSFDLAVAHKLNLMGNELTAKGRELRSQERKARQTQKLVDPRSDDKVATDKT